MEEASGTELTSKLTEHLKEIVSHNKVKATVLPMSQTNQTVVTGQNKHSFPQKAHTHSLCPCFGSTEKLVPAGKMGV